MGKKAAVQKSSAASVPGVWIAESSGPKPIEPFAGATAFIGAALKGRLNRAVKVSSFREFENLFGPAGPGNHHASAVMSYFANGGNAAWIVRVSRSKRKDRIQKALKALDKISIGLLALPGETGSYALSEAEAWCRARRAFLLIDAPAGLQTPGDVRSFISAGSLPKSSYCAFYYPWIKMKAAGRPFDAPPSGAVAGLIAKTDSTRGLWKAPAGTEPLAGVEGLGYMLTAAENDSLSPLSVNCLRFFRGEGFVVWGARTLFGSGEEDFKYVPVRRLMIFIERSVSDGIAWAVFEPNGENLWTRVRASVENFLTGLWKQGALQGVKPEHAFFVKCGRETMTQEDIEAGRLNVLIGTAPLKPAEFVLLRIRIPPEA